MRQRFRSGGLAAWSINRPIAVAMLALSVVVLGLFSIDRLSIDLLPHIIYPEIRVRILEPGVPARIMEDQITRQLEEQLAITEGTISIQSSTSEGRSNVDLSFPYGTDIDLALRDASTRLDRAKRFLSNTIEPPVIYKRDPSQIPILELAVGTSERQSSALRDWVDYEFSNWFLNIPGVASAEVGGGQQREIQILVDQERLASLGLDFNDIKTTLEDENRDYPGGRLFLGNREVTSRTTAKVIDPLNIGDLPLKIDKNDEQDPIRIRDVARIIDSQEEARIRVRLNQQPSIKLSIQKQPEANTVDVVDAVMHRLDWLKQQKIIPQDITISSTSDQSIYIRHALNNAITAVLSGALLAMLVVYLFLGDIFRTIVIGLAIPLAIFVTLIIMALLNLTLNIMTLGGLALGVGMLVDNAIVMLENISRHQAIEPTENNEYAITAAQEVNSAIVASTSTNLAAILPFLFIGGLIGLLFSELIITLSAAILASLLVALTIVPAYGAKYTHVSTHQSKTKRFDRIFSWVQQRYLVLVKLTLNNPRWLVFIIIPLFLLSAYYLSQGKQIFLPQMDEGNISISIRGDSGTQLEEMDAIVKSIEAILNNDPDVLSVFTTVGGFIFGRSEFESSHYSNIKIQLAPSFKRKSSSRQWIKRNMKKIDALQLVGFKVNMRVTGIRGVRLNRGDDDISLRIQGDDIETLRILANQVIETIDTIPGLSNLQQSYEDINEEVVVQIDRERSALLNISPSNIGNALQSALDGIIVSKLLDKDRQYNIRLRIPREEANNKAKLENLLVGHKDNTPIRLRDVAYVVVELSPSKILRDNQRRMVEISASISGDAAASELLKQIDVRMADFDFPDGYTLYDGGLKAQLQQNSNTGYILLALAIFLVFSVMAIQYESLRNPIIILVAMPFTIIGVALGLWVTTTPLSMPVWLGLIMLAGIVVNNAIVLVEHIEIERERGLMVLEAILESARLRLRPILMTTLTTAVGMLPLALGVGEGSEMLQPLAIVIVWGLAFSTIVSLIVVPSLYLLFYRKDLTQLKS